MSHDDGETIASILVFNPGNQDIPEHVALHVRAEAVDFVPPCEIKVVRRGGAIERRRHRHSSVQSPARARIDRFPSSASNTSHLDS